MLACYTAEDSTPALLAKHKAKVPVVLHSKMIATDAKGPVKGCELMPPGVQSLFER